MEIITCSTRRGILNWSPYVFWSAPFEGDDKGLQYMVLIWIATVYVGVVDRVVYMDCFY